MIKKEKDKKRKGICYLERHEKSTRESSFELCAQRLRAGRLTWRRNSPGQREYATRTPTHASLRLAARRVASRRVALHKGYALISVRYAPLRFSGFARVHASEHSKRRQLSRARDKGVFAWAHLRHEEFLPRLDPRRADPPLLLIVRQRWIASSARLTWEIEGMEIGVASDRLLRPLLNTLKISLSTSWMNVE